MATEAIEDAGDAWQSWRDADDAQLVAAMRRGTGAAFAEVFRRFAPMLTAMARRRQVPDADREAIVTEYLEDTLLKLAADRRRAPSPLGPYLATGFRRRLISLWRQRTAAEEREQQLGDSMSEGERVVAESLSTYAAHAATGGGEETSDESDQVIDPLAQARFQLARTLASTMTPEERRIMGHVAERYPQREIAAAFGIAPTAMRVRIHRIRERLVAAAAQYIGDLPVADGIRLARFLEVPRAESVKKNTERRSRTLRDSEDTP